MCWHQLPAPVIGGQVCRLPRLSVEEWMDIKRLFDEKTLPTWPHRAVVDVQAKTVWEKMLAQFRTSYVKDDIDQTNSIQTKA